MSNTRRPTRRMISLSVMPLALAAAPALAHGNHDAALSSFAHVLFHAAAFMAPALGLVGIFVIVRRLRRQRVNTR